MIHNMITGLVIALSHTATAAYTLIAVDAAGRPLPNEVFISIGVVVGVLAAALTVVMAIDQRQTRCRWAERDVAARKAAGR
jgi:hypothetical protein